jgi:GT2 family glycosyltransferase
MAAGAPVVSVVVVSWNTKEVLRQCLASVRAHLAEVAHETIVVDNASGDGSAEMVAADFPEARLVRNRTNVGFGAANNVGMLGARGEFFLLLNSDARLVDGSIGKLVELLRTRPRVGVVGPRLRYEDGRLQPSAQRFDALRLRAVEELGLYKLLPRARAGRLLLAGYFDHEQEVDADWILGACMLVRREAFEQTGGFDPAIFLYGEEEEWCYRIRAAGWAVVFSPVAEVVHIGHVSADQLLGTEGRLERCLVASDRLLRRWEGPVAGALAPGLRVAGALLRLTGNRDVRRTSRTVLRHYFRRALRSASPPWGRG